MEKLESDTKTVEAGLVSEQKVKKAQEEQKD